MYKGEDVVIEALKKHKYENKKYVSIEELQKLTGIQVDSLRRVLEVLRSSSHISLETKESPTYKISQELESYMKPGSFFPEYSVFQKALESKPIGSLSEQEKSKGLKWAKAKGFVTIENGTLKALKTLDEVEKELKKIKELVSRLPTNHKIPDDSKTLLEELEKRNLVEVKLKKETFISYTGKEYAAEASFNVSTPAEDAQLGKNHIITVMANKVRSIMVELGFEEMEGDIVESSFWNFDALFQPQDHPARELADTFYVKGKDEPSDKDIVKKIKAEHEKFWKSDWKIEEASKKVLRTHTTAVTARYLSNLSKNKDKNPKKYFAIGRVFRNEATDYKHLAEFHQVEGIVVYENATFSDLLGILKEFYKRLGFEKIRFRPSFFPYTEPSLEIEVYFESRKQWMELGGAGILRPQVSIPLAGTYPVLAWGLSLERPLMLSLGLEDIRDLYKNDLDFLEKTRMKV